VEARHGDEAVRIDRWLVAARLARTRSRAREACDGGKVHLNGRAVPAHRLVRSGDRIRLSRGAGRRLELVVLALGERRLGPEAARALYRALAAEPATSAPSVPGPPGEDPGGGPRGGRPGKRDRRRIDRWKRGEARG